MIDTISNLIERVNIGPLERDFQGNSTEIENFFWALQKHVIGGLNKGDMITDLNYEEEARRLASEFIFAFFRINESVEERLMGYPGVGRSKLASERENLTTFRNKLIQEFHDSSNQILSLLFGLREPLLKEQEFRIEALTLQRYAHLKQQSLPLFIASHLNKDPESDKYILPISLDRNLVISLHKQFKPAAESFFKLHMIDDFLKPFEVNPHIPYIKTSEYRQKKEDRGQIYLSKLDFRTLD